MLILIADAFDKSLPEKLSIFGEVTTDIERLGEADVVLIRSKTKATKDYIDKAKNAQLLSIARSVYTAAQIEVSEAYARGPIYVEDLHNTNAKGNYPSIRNIVCNSELKEWGNPGEDFSDRAPGNTNYLINGFGFGSVCALVFSGDVQRIVDNLVSVHGIYLIS